MTVYCRLAAACTATISPAAWGWRPLLDASGDESGPVPAAMRKEHLRRQRPVRQDGRMADRYRTKDGWSVEIVQLTCTPDHHDGEWLRIRYFGYHH